MSSESPAPSRTVSRHRYGLVAGVTALLALLIVEEPDLGTSAVVVLTVLAMVFAAGLNWRARSSARGSESGRPSA